MSWTATLNSRFFRLDYQISMKDGEGSGTTFAGVAYYKQDETEGFWVDNSGDIHPITAETDSNKLVAHWGKKGGKQGRTRYELSPLNTITVTDWILTDGDWKQFNSNEFRREN